MARGEDGGWRGASVSGVNEELASFCAAEHERLVGLLTLVTADRFLAEELGQEALARLCAHWSRVRDMHNPRAWLRRVALNLAASRYRRRQAEWRANRRHGQPSDHEEDTATSVAVRGAVSSLPPRQRTVIALRYYVGLDVAQTATEMGCAQGTVKSLTNKAVTRLRDQLLDPQEIHS